ncbi:MAG TPA: 3-oxoacyl-ACP reductase family protein [Pseudolabrys sp.]|nr:3-oxoacyl-ACP reductase family protein [Pseudolabrys sp.]
MGRLDGKTALITGGSRGIGAATALRFAREGAHVGIMGRSEKNLAAMSQSAAREKLTIETFAGDVGNKDDAARCVDGFVKRMSRIDILVNNAGIGIGRPFPEKTVDDWNETLRINLIGTFLMAQAAAKHMVAAKAGKIVNVSSVRGLEHLGREPVMDYSASKAAVISLTKTLAKQLAPNINVNVVVPGNTETEMLKALPEEVRAGMLAGTYFRRFAKPEEIANAILFLASAEADFITGQSLVVDGGFSLKAG